MSIDDGVASYIAKNFDPAIKSELDELGFLIYIKEKMRIEDDFFQLDIHHVRELFEDALDRGMGILYVCNQELEERGVTKRGEEKGRM